ncbi:MAG: sigma 54-interacting transcriptional regulator, partial [Planctomycetota bacterium]
VGAGEGRVEAPLDPEAADPAPTAGDEPARRRLGFVCHGAAACTDATSVHDLVRAFLDLTVQTWEPDRATVSLRAPGGADRITAAHPHGASAPSSRTLRRRVLEGGEAVLVRDSLDATGEDGAASLVASRYRSTLAAPLVTSEGVLGFVAVEAQAASRFDAEDLAALAAAARQAALAIRNLRSLAAARAAVGRLTPDAQPASARLIGSSPPMQAVRIQIEKAAGVDSPVLITGETGTGKELVARLLHAGGARGGEPFVALNCAAIVEGLLEDELFGHEKGAFTGATDTRDGRIAQAGAGTLFLDEIGDLSPGLQAKLLRVLSEGTYRRVGGHREARVGCRILTATNRDLEAMVEEKTFRRDLYYRFAVLHIQLPPLRERGEDVLLLAEAGLETIAARLGRPVPRVAEDAEARLLAYAWPGNVRELLNVLERAVVLAPGDTLTAADFPLDIARPGPPRAPAGEDDVLTLREAEKRAVEAALRAAGGRKGRAAEILGISRPRLNRKIREYGIGPDSGSGSGSGSGSR